VRWRTSLIAGAGIALLLFLFLRERDPGAREERRERVGAPRSESGLPLRRDEGKRPVETPAIPVRENPPADRPESGAVDRLIASIDWPAYGGALLAYLRAQEEARRRGLEPEVDAETMDLLSKANVVLDELGRLLGIGDPRELLYHEKIAPGFARGWMKALEITLSPAQDRGLETRAREFSRSRNGAPDDGKGANRLERLAREAQRGLLWDEEIEKLLQPDQFSAYAKPAGQDAFWGRAARHQEVQGGSATLQARGVEEFWAKTFGLDPTSHPVLMDAASRYVGEVQRRVALFQAQYPAGAPRSEKMRLDIGLVRLQTEIEREFAQKLSLTGAQKALVAEGSGTILDLRGE
jgi:hypothetical protein